MRKYLTEFVGTGTALMVVVFMGGHVSGAQYNPAFSGIYRIQHGFA